MKHLLEPDEAASRLDVSERTLRRWRTTGEGPAYHMIGGRVRYDVKDLELWLKEQRVVGGGAGSSSGGSAA